MHTVHSTWTYRDRQNFWEHYNYEYSTGDLETLNWYVEPFLPDYEYTTQWDNTLIGGYDQNGFADQYDLTQVWLEAGETYDFVAVGADPVALELIDTNGNLLVTRDGDNFFGYGYDDRVADLLVDMYNLNPWVEADTIVNYTPSYTGWATIVVAGEGNVLWMLPTEVSIVGLQHAKEVVPVPKPKPYLIDNDNNYWDADIADGNGYVVKAEDAQLYRSYMGAMGRTPDEGGFNWWADKIENGEHSLISMAEGFIFSDEFMGYADTDRDDQISNDEFVTHMYEGVFGRAPDQDGYDWWMNELDTENRTQGEVLLDMTQSNEYVELTMDVVADYLFT